MQYNTFFSTLTKHFNTSNTHLLLCLFHQLIACFELKTTQLSALLLFPKLTDKTENVQEKYGKKAKCILPVFIYGIYVYPYSPALMLHVDDDDKAEFVSWKAISTRQKPSLFCIVSKQGKEPATYDYDIIHLQTSRVVVVVKLKKTTKIDREKGSRKGRMNHSNMRG